MKKLWFAIMGMIFFLACTIFAPVELTMYIMRYAEQYGYYPEAALLMETDLILELITIWFFYIVGLAFVLWLILMKREIKL